MYAKCNKTNAQNVLLELNVNKCIHSEYLHTPNKKMHTKYAKYTKECHV